MDTDSRTASMPSVTGQGARSYVGVPVVRVDGSFYGTLCGIDPSNHESSEESVRFLQVVARLLAYQLDRDELMQAQARTRDELATLAEALKERADFEEQLIGIVSHDLKTPLAAIIMSASLLARQPSIGEAGQRSVQRVLYSAQRATRMVHTLLDLTHARAGELAVEAVPTDLGEVAQRATDEVSQVHPGRTIQVEVAGDVSGQWDPDRLAQVAINLIENAVVYSEPATPIRVRVAGEQDGVTLAVSNVGKPISPHLLPHIFEPLKRGEERGTRRSVGLGLFIARKLVDAHGGSIFVESAGRATTFEVRLPRAVPAELRG